jgi:4-hydroxyacetophenone monooxygenase
MAAMLDSLDTTDVAIRDALAAADLRVLLMSLFHMTGDDRWLGSPFLPQRDVRLVADPQAGLSGEAAREIQAAAARMLASPGRPAVHDPGDRLMQRMMSVCLGERVPAEYAPMMRQELGFTTPQWEAPPLAISPAATEDVPVLVVGAGLSGLALAAHLEHLRIPYLVVEKNEEVGGTWWENRYPGAGVDTPSHAYSYSFGPSHNWGRFFALQPELQGYILRFAEELGLRDRIRTSTQVVSATWSEALQHWSVELRNRTGEAETLRAKVLVSAIGILNDPFVPDIPGLESFQGPRFHSARWPEDIDLRGARIALIGTGASAIQILPQVAETAADTTVYQRSPQWIRPIEGYQDDISPASRWLIENVPYYRQWMRLTMFWRYADGLLKTLRKDPTWPHPDRSVNRRNDLHREELTQYIHDELEGDPELIRKCLPTYPPFGKRILLDTGWYRSLRRPDVTLVTESISAVTEDAIVTAAGERRATDVIVLATGFKVTELAARLNLTGRNGLDLRQAWRDDNPTAYLGMTVPGFPNFFTMLGPNSGLGHGGSAIFQSECQARYISTCVARMFAERISALEVREAAHADYIRQVDEEHDQLIWTHRGMTNWYRNKHGRVVAIMPWRLVDYWSMTRAPDWSAYHLR